MLSRIGCATSRRGVVAALVQTQELIPTEVSNSPKVSQSWWELKPGLSRSEVQVLDSIL